MGADWQIMQPAAPQQPEVDAVPQQEEPQEEEPVQFRPFTLPEDESAIVHQQIRARIALNTDRGAMIHNEDTYREASISGMLGSK